MKWSWFKNWVGHWKVFFKEDDSPYRSPVIRDGNMVTINKKKDILSEDFISSGSKK